MSPIALSQCNIRKKKFELANSLILPRRHVPTPYLWIPPIRLPVRIIWIWEGLGVITNTWTIHPPPLGTGLLRIGQGLLPCLAFVWSEVVCMRLGIFFFFCEMCTPTTLHSMINHWNANKHALGITTHVLPFTCFVETMQTPTLGLMQPWSMHPWNLPIYASKPANALSCGKTTSWELTDACSVRNSWNPSIFGKKTIFLLFPTNDGHKSPILVLECAFLPSECLIKSFSLSLGTTMLNVLLTHCESP